MKSMPYVNRGLYEFAKVWNRVGGGTDYSPANIDPNTGEYKVAHSIFNLNPSSIEYFGEYYLGGTGRFVNQTYKTIEAAVRYALADDDRRQDIDFDSRNIPIYNRFVTTPRKSMEYYRQYWILSDEMKTRTFYRNQARREGDPNGILRTYYEGPMVAAENEFNRYKARIDALTDRISISHDAQKKQELIKERDKLVKEAVTKIEKLKGES